uniref:Uncharacterized protein n=1 Tax=viral metagenome TaxID=1070528 RepID=A0A6M3KTB0_9ZZZZ
MELKPGYKTTEFWTVMANAVFMALVSFGLIEQASADALLALIVTLIAAVLPMVLYIWSRTQVKAAG